MLADDKALYSYDEFNRTTTVETIDGNVQVNRYDAEGLRHELEENGRLVQFIFNDNREVIAEQDENKWISYIRASSLLASSTEHSRTYYHYASDEMGSITHIVDGDGAVQNRYEYDAWGNVTEQTENIPNRFKFNGQQLDPISQQYYLRARFYNPVIARFTQEDTYRGDGLNLYAYCQNNPVVYDDPTGNACEPQANLLQKQQGKTTYTNQSGHTFTQDANNRWHDASGRFTSDPTGVNQPKKPKATVPTDKAQNSVFPSNPDNFLPEILRAKVVKPNGTTSQTIQTSDLVRIRAETHPVLSGETYNPRHHGTHYHVEYKKNAGLSWNNKGNVTKFDPPGYSAGQGTGFLPGESFPK